MSNISIDELAAAEITDTLLALETPAAVTQLTDEDITALEIMEFIAEPEALPPLAEELARLDGFDQAAAVANEPDEAQAPAVAEGETGDFEEIAARVTEQQVTELTRDLLAAFQERATYERQVNPNNDNIQKTISKLIKGMTPGVVRSLVVAGRDASLVNESEVAGKRRNVYALDKMRDILYGALTGYVSNKVNKAVIESMVRLRGTGLPVTSEVVKACVSQNAPVGAQYLPYLTRHTMAPQTAPTQSSSTGTALEVLGVVTNKGTKKNPVLEFTDSPLAKHLIAQVTKKMGGVAA